MFRIHNPPRWRKVVSKRWYQENKRDPWRRDAKSKGYRARSAYKLKQIQERFGILKLADSVLDIGCYPGGWTQVAVEEVGTEGIVIGVDILATSPVEGATTLVGDITNEGTVEAIMGVLDGRGLNVVISDISPRLTGRYDTDQAISLELSTMALDVASRLLVPKGCFVTKVFQGAGIEGIVEAARLRFSSVGRFSPTASRTASSETYLICQNRLKKNKGDGKTAMEYLQRHLGNIGIVVERDQGTNDDSLVGFRKIEKRE